jgi:hypothetical protein
MKSIRTQPIPAAWARSRVKASCGPWGMWTLTPKGDASAAAAGRAGAAASRARAIRAEGKNRGVCFKVIRIPVEIWISIVLPLY